MRTTAILCSLGLAFCVIRGAAEAQTTPVRITGDSLGTLPLQVPLGDLVQRIPTGKRVAWRGWDIGYPSFAFRIGTLRVWAVQKLESPDGVDTIPGLDPTKPADFYALEGRGGILPTGGLTGSSWGQLRRGLGPVVVFAEGGMPIHVRPCRYPWLVIGFPGGRIRPRSDGTILPTSLPKAARAEYFHVQPRESGVLADPRCPSDNNAQQQPNER